MRYFIAGVLIFFLAFPLMAQRKIALIVTIDNYPNSEKCNDCWPRTYANKDLNELWKVFHKQKFDIVDTLTESRATRKGIMKALDDLAKKAEKGSIVVFHFSGHGQQIYDVDDPAKGLYIDEADGYDEALVPYDAKRLYSENGYKGENHIRDEELGAKLDTIRKNIGRSGSLLVLADACYSGTITRDVKDRGIFRGTSDKIEPPGYIRAQVIGEKNFLYNNRDDTAFCPMVVISGSAQDQFNYAVDFNGEGPIGALTNAFIKALENFREPVNYRVFFDWIKETIETNRDGQNPMMEGDDSMMVLGNRVIPSSGYVVVRPVRDYEDSVQLNRGMVHDIFPGMEFSVYPLNVFTYDSLQVVARGRIAKSDPFNAIGVLDKKLNTESVFYKAIFNTRAFGIFSCTLNITGNSSSIQRVRENAKKYKNILVSEKNSDLNFKEINSGSPGIKRLIAMRTGISDSRYDTVWQKDFRSGVDIDSAELNNLFGSIRKYARANYMRSFGLPPNDSTFKEVKVLVIPVIAHNKIGPCKDPAENKDLLTPIVDKEIPEDRYRRNKGPVEIKAIKKDDDERKSFQALKIKVVNNSEKAVFLSVLEIQPDNIINVRVPVEFCDGNKYVSPDPANFKIGAMDSTTFWPTLGFSPPYGLEYLKILISDNSFDLSRRDGTLKDVSLHKGFDDFFNEIINDNSGRKNYFVRKDDKPESTVPVRAGSMKVVTYTFKIVE